MTGNEIAIMKTHVSLSSHSSLKISRVVSKYRAPTCKIIESAMAAIRYGLTNGGTRSTDCPSETELHALNISITTSTVSATELAYLQSGLPSLFSSKSSSLSDVDRATSSAQFFKGACVYEMLDSGSVPSGPRDTSDNGTYAQMKPKTVAQPTYVPMTE